MGGGGNKATGTTASSTPPPAGSAAAPASTADAPASPTSTAPPTSYAAAAAATAAASPASPVGTVAAPALAAGTAVELKNRPVPVAVAPIQKKKYTKKSDHPVRDDNEPGPSQEQEKEAEPEIITRSLSLSELRGMRKDFSHHPGEHIVTWLLRCWDNGASSLELEGRQATQLGSLAREGGIDKAIGKKAQALSLWRRLLSDLRERYSCSEDFVCYPGKWTNMERGSQYLRELAVRELVYYDLDIERLPTDPDEVQCTQSMWRKFIQSAPSSYASSLAIIDWKG